jgi:hypothetical protein
MTLTQAKTIKRWRVNNKRPFSWIWAAFCTEFEITESDGCELCCEAATILGDCPASDSSKEWWV